MRRFYQGLGGALICALLLLPSAMALVSYAGLFSCAESAGIEVGEGTNTTAASEGTGSPCPRGNPGSDPVRPDRPVPGLAWLQAARRSANRRTAARPGVES